MSAKKIGIGLLSLSATALIGMAVEENYVGEAMVPTKNDRPTLGFGSTFHEDGTPVKMGERTTPVKALITLQAHVSKEEAVFRQSIEGAELSQPEFDVYMNWVYQYGSGAWLTSSMRTEVLAGDYAAACRALLEYRFLKTTTPTEGWEVDRRDAAGKPTRWRFDCSTPGNKVCRGVWTRQQMRHADCMAAQ